MQCRLAAIGCRPAFFFQARLASSVVGPLEELPDDGLGLQDVYEGVRVSQADGLLQVARPREERCVMIRLRPYHAVHLVRLGRDDQQGGLGVLLVEEVYRLGGGVLEDNRIQGRVPAEQDSRDAEDDAVEGEDDVPRGPSRPCK